MNSKVTITYLFLMIVLINLAQAIFTEVPPPPKRPEHFRTKEELKRYLQKLHEYHMIVGRWRSRRNYDDQSLLNTPTDDLFRYLDINNDHYISNDEFSQRLKFRQEDQVQH